MALELQSNEYNRNFNHCAICIQLMKATMTQQITSICWHAIIQFRCSGLWVHHKDPLAQRMKQKFCMAGKTFLAGPFQSKAFSSCGLSRIWGKHI
jgi:hypothetical protein